VNDTVSEPALIEKLELRADIVRQGGLAASHHDRAQEQMALVDQPCADRLAGELGMRTYQGAENCGALAILDAARVDGAIADFYAAAQHCQG
jgi:hypothetical protein